MMTVLEYATDVNRSVEEILEKCHDLEIDVNSENDELSEEDIINLDNNLDDIDSYEEEVEEETEKIEMKAAKAKTVKKLNKSKGENKESFDKQNFAKKKKKL